ncbi:FAD-binding domain-containing protein [Variovorax sp. RHLX14]|uniref:FAD-binding domain-containing protein n=1 Tax=Variovorax sp. RHLX14 TaxID=1259731 RepID=UPI003F44E8C3
MTKALLWLADDLRMEDNLALDLGLSAAYSGCMAVRIQPEARGRPRRTANRRALEDAAESALIRSLSVLGVHLSLLGNGDELSLVRLCRESGCSVVIRNAADGSPAEAECRDRLERELADEGIPLLIVNGELIRRSGPGGDRPDVPHLSDDESVAPSRIAADHPIALLRAFLKRLPDSDYEAGMWMPANDRSSTSQLSTHFAAGVLSSDRACLETMRAKALWLAHHPGQAGTVAGKSFGAFHRRVNMRKGFLASYSKRCSKYLQPLAAPRDSPTAATANLWRLGQTGIPMPDAAMRELAATGWINFRLRQLAASYGIQLLGLHPDEVGVALAEMFDDYEPGITWLQVAINEGTLGEERGPRILNPVKQGHDLDPDEVYVRHWIPELSDVPKGLGHEPWMLDCNPLSPPIVDHRAALRDAKAKWNKNSRVSPQLVLF